MCIRDSFPILLIYGFPPLGTMGRLAWWRLTYPKHLTGYGTRHCSPSSLTLGFLLLFAYLCLVFSQIAQYRLLLTGDFFFFFCQLWCSSGFCLISYFILTFH